MAVNANLWKRTFGALDPSSLPAWPCPTCGSTKLVLNSKSILYRPNKVQFSSEDFKKDDFELNTFLGVLNAFAHVYEKLQFVQHKFIGYLICSECGESIMISGRAEIPKEVSNKPTQYSTRIYPEYFSPPLNFFFLDKRYPLSVRQNFIRSFSLTLNDVASASNAMRQGIESLLDELFIPRENERNKRLTLSDRLDRFGETYAECAEMLEGVRILGNEGSHTGKVIREDLIQAFEVIDHVLEEIFIRQIARRKMLESSKNLANTYKSGPKLLKGPESN